MMTYSSSFWPLFWTIIGGGALLTVLAVLVVAAFSPSRWGHGSAPAELATVHRQSAAYGYQATRDRKAA